MYSIIMSEEDEGSVFDTNTEIFAAWMLICMFGCLTWLLYFLTVIRVPPSPMLEKVFGLIAVPSVLPKHLYAGLEWIKMKSGNYIARLRDLNKEIDMKPLNTDSGTSDVVRSTSEDMSAAIIGVPLEEDLEEINDKENAVSVSSSSPKAPEPNQKQQVVPTLVDLS